MDAPEQASDLAALDAEDATTAAETPAPRMVRRVACGYQAGVLPGEWLQTWRRLDRLFERSGLKVKALLTPLDDLGEDIDVLVVPPELRDDAEARVGTDVPIVVTTPAEAPIEFAELVRR